ncbi:trafficking protein particle complex subunit 1, partial [Malurus melanocephalus]|uniref:trafficking protein particle complex subunit 1 n=1 Tax=Malurus melanocephalus TaxID=175006 RepID=UPI0025485402
FPKSLNFSPNLQEFKLMFGMLFSLRSFVAKMSPTDMRDGFVSFHTSRYRLHYLETPTGLRLVLNTDLGVANAREALQHIYSNVRKKKFKNWDWGEFRGELTKITKILV